MEERLVTAKRTNRVAWGLVAALTVALLTPLVVLGVTCGNRLAQGKEVGRLSLAPRLCWGLGWSTLMMSYGPGGLYREWLVVGCFAWRVEYDTPLTSANPSPHRSWWGEKSPD
jgi:hypothetical protein